MGRAAIVAAIGIIPNLASADAIDDLEPGTWYAIPDTPMRAVCPEDTPQYEWSFYCRNVIAAWGGAALDSARGRLIVWGGGHGDYRGNEVYAFDLHALTWARLWGPTPDDQIPSGGTHEQYDDGSPGSRHTYSGLTYLPPPHDALLSTGGSLWQSGSYGVGVWRFDLAANAWTRLADGPGGSFGDPSVFDPQTGHVFRRANDAMLEYDPDADAFAPRAPSDGGFWAANVSAALDPDARLMVIIGEGRVDTYDLGTDTYVQDVAVAGATVEELFGGAAPGVAFDTQQARFVVYGGGQEVYTYDPVTASFAMHGATGDDPGPITGSGGAFGRFRYVPSRNVFVWVDDVDANVFVLRMSEGTGVPPDPPGDDTTGGSESTDGGDSTGSPGDGSTSAVVDSTVGSDAGSGPGGSTSSPGAGGDEGGGCSCRARAPDEGVPWLWAGLACLGLRRRARRPGRAA